MEELKPPEMYFWKLLGVFQLAKYKNHRNSTDDLYSVGAKGDIGGRGGGWENMGLSIVNCHLNIIIRTDNDDCK